LCYYVDLKHVLGFVYYVDLKTVKQISYIGFWIFEMINFNYAHLM